AAHGPTDDDRPGTSRRRGGRHQLRPGPPLPLQALAGQRTAANPAQRRPYLPAGTQSRTAARRAAPPELESRGTCAAADARAGRSQPAAAAKELDAGETGPDRPADRPPQPPGDGPP